MCAFAEWNSVTPIGLQHSHVFFLFSHYVSTGTDEAMSWLETELEKAYEIKMQKLGWADGYKSEGKVLNRVVRRTE